MKSGKIFAVLTCFLFLFGANTASATSFTVNGITFSEDLENLVIDKVEADGNGFKLYEKVSGLDVTLKIEGLADYGNDDKIGLHSNAFWLEKIVTNDTGEVWNFYDHELQSVLGVASSDGDLLSFAQGTTNSVRPWTSDEFASVDEITDVRDYVNFFDGTVANGDTVRFRFAISYNGTATDPVWLRQRPNFSTTQVPDTDPDPVPEPATLVLLGLGLFGLAGFSRKKIKG